MSMKSMTRLTTGLAVAGIVSALALPAAAGRQVRRCDTAGRHLWRIVEGKPRRDHHPEVRGPGGKIEYVTGSPQANLAKLIAGRGRAPFDVMEILDAQVPDFAATDFLAKIDLSKVPNTKYLADFQYNDMMVASWNTQETICYDKDKFAELGVARPTTYSDLAIPRAGRPYLHPGHHVGRRSGQLWRLRLCGGW